MSATRRERRRKLLTAALPFPAKGRAFLVNTGLDFLAREAAERLGPEGVRVVERDLRGYREMQGALAGLSVEHAARAEPEAGDLVLLPAPKSRRELFLELERLAGLLGAEGCIALYGDRKEGIGPAQTLLERHCDLDAPVVRAGGRLLLARPREGEDWGLEPAEDRYTTRARGVEIRVAARPGIFSWDELDPATAMLLDHCKPRSGDRLLDLGCGAGVVAAALLVEGLVSDATLCDTDALALETAARTLALNGIDIDGEMTPAVRILADDAGEGLPDRRFDLICVNPPHHREFAYERDSFRRMVVQAERLLAPKGRLVMVGPASLALGRAMAGSFAEPQMLADSGSFQVWRAVKRKPRRERDAL